MPEEKKFTGFTEDHVNLPVYDVILGKGVLTKLNPGATYPVLVRFERGEEARFTLMGTYFTKEKYRRLYFGHKIKVEVTGEEIPEPKLICPVCKIEHALIGNSHVGHCTYYYDIINSDCPLMDAEYGEEDTAKKAMENLIKAMEKS